MDNFLDSHWQWVHGYLTLFLSIFIPTIQNVWMSFKIHEFSQGLNVHRNHYHCCSCTHHHRPTSPEVVESLILYFIFYILYLKSWFSARFVSRRNRACAFHTVSPEFSKEIFYQSLVNNSQQLSGDKAPRKVDEHFFGKCHNLNFQQLWLSGWCECGGWADVEYWYAFVSHLPALPYLYLLSQYSPAENYRLEYFWLLWSIDVFVSLIYVPYFLVLIAQDMKTTHLPKYCAKHSTPNVNTLILLWPCGNFISSAHVAGCTQNVI